MCLGEGNSEEHCSVCAMTCLLLSPAIQVSPFVQQLRHMTQERFCVTLNSSQLLCRCKHNLTKTNYSLRIDLEIITAKDYWLLFATYKNKASIAEYGQKFIIVIFYCDKLMSSRVRNWLQKITIIIFYIIKK